MDAQQAEKGPTNALALGSFLVGLLWLGGLGSILAIVLGNRARDEIRRTDQTGENLAFAGIALGWLGIVASVIVFTAMAGAFSQTGPDVRGAPTGPEVDRVAAQLNVESALEDAAAAQHAYFSRNGIYTTDISVLTEAGVYPVALEPVRATDDGFCVEATTKNLKGPSHITESSKKVQRGSC